MERERYESFPFLSPLVGDIPWMLTILQRKDSPYRDSLTMDMLRMEATGLLRDKNIPDTMNIIGRSSKLYKSYQEKEQPLRVSVIRTMLIFLVTCLLLLILSLFSFICEKLKIGTIFSQPIREVRLRFQYIIRRKKECTESKKSKVVKT